MGTWRNKTSGQDLRWVGVQESGPRKKGNTNIHFCYSFRYVSSRTGILLFSKFQSCLSSGGQILRYPIRNSQDVGYLRSGKPLGFDGRFSGKNHHGSASGNGKLVNVQMWYSSASQTSTTLGLDSDTLSTGNSF